jgi:pantetheine-phosphate adenylyltransferase
MNNENHIALYPGTFDPITKGHTGLIRRGARLFKKVIIGIAKSPKKSPLLNLEDREYLVKAVLADLPNIEVCHFDGLTIQLAKEKKASLLLRGIRISSDLNDELSLNYMNKSMCPDLETIFLFPSPEHAYISSSIVKEIAQMGGDVSSFVDEVVKKKLQSII